MAEKIAATYTSAKANKIDLHRCRLKAELYKQTRNEQGYATYAFVDEDTSSDIIDDRDQNVGSFDLQCMSDPNYCCNKGECSKLLKQFAMLLITYMLKCHL